MFITKKALQKKIDEAVSPYRIGMQMACDTDGRRCDQIEKLILGNNGQSAQIVQLTQDLDNTRQELDAWKKRFDQLSAVASELAVLSAQQAAELEEALTDSDLLDEVLETVMSECEKCKHGEPKKKGKKNG